jgi:hypothetical protein
MDSKILGINTDTFYALLFLVLLLILGIVSFHYYVFIKAGGHSALNAGIGAGFTLLPGMGHGKHHPMQFEMGNEQHRHHKGCGHMMDMDGQM